MNVCQPKAADRSAEFYKGRNAVQEAEKMMNEQNNNRTADNGISLSDFCELLFFVYFSLFSWFNWILFTIGFSICSWNASCSQRCVYFVASDDFAAVNWFLHIAIVYNGFLCRGRIVFNANSIIAFDLCGSTGSKRIDNILDRSAWPQNSIHNIINWNRAGNAHFGIAPFIQRSTAKHQLGANICAVIHRVHCTNGTSIGANDNHHRCSSS